MSTQSQEQLFARIVHRVLPQAELLRVWQLEGGVSARVTGMEVLLLDGTRRKWIVRQHGPRDLAANPQVAMHEFRLLLQLHTAALPVPAPIFVDVSNEILPSPYIVIQYIEGEKDFAPADLPAYLHQAASQLALIHSLDQAQWDFSFLPGLQINFEPQPESRTFAGAPSPDYAHIRNVLQSAWTLLRFNDPVLLHGDYWPGNLLWRDGHLVAVLDWEDAKTGDPLADLANTRLEILWAFGEEAVNLFTRHYRELINIDYTNLAFWDLWAAHKAGLQIGNWGLDAEASAKILRDLHRFAEVELINHITRAPAARLPAGSSHLP